MGMVIAVDVRLLIVAPTVSVILNMLYGAETKRARME
jgi:hypothetical protein